MTTYSVPKSHVQFRQSERGGMESRWEKNGEWHLTFRTLEELLEMWPEAVPDAIPTADPTTNEDKEREIFGETLDEPIPDDIWDMLSSI